MKKLKVMTVAGTRPEIIRLSRIIDKLDRSNAIDHVFVHTGQNYDYELNEIFFEDLTLRKPDYTLAVARDNAAETIAEIISGVDLILEKERPDAFLILGDTNSCLSAIAAKKRRIPVFHMEAGNRCFDQRVPEETNRKIVDHIADINLTYSHIAREYLLREGFPPDRIIRTGSPMAEVLDHYMDKILRSTVLQELGLTKEGYFVLSLHREENISGSGNLQKIAAILDSIADRYDRPIIFSCHPRTRKALNGAGVALHELVRVMPPFAMTDYNSLQMNSFAVLSDSGTINEEASLLGFRALNLRESHERPEAMEEAAVMMTGLNPDRIMQCLEELADKTWDPDIAADYTVRNVSGKTVRIILSYTDYVKRTVYAGSDANS